MFVIETANFLDKMIVITTTQIREKKSQTSSALISTYWLVSLASGLFSRSSFATCFSFSVNSGTSVLQRLFS